MSRRLIILRREIADRQRLAGVALADAIRLQRASADIFAVAAMSETVDSIIDRIESYTQQLLEIDRLIEEELLEREPNESPFIKAGVEPY